VNLDDRRLRQEVVRNLQKHGTKEGLVGFELLAGIVIAFEPWDKKLRMVDGTVDREKVAVKYKSSIEVRTFFFPFGLLFKY
jgi:hypothetical protein